MSLARASRSPWQALFKTAAGQEGLFSANQAKALGVSQQLLAKYMGSGRVVRVRRALYRISDFPAGPYEDLVATWLWSRNEGVFSHETALFLHELSDAMPIHAHITLPTSWKRRAVKIPDDVTPYHADIPTRDKSWVGSLPVTSVRRTLSDCLHASVAPELIAQASTSAASRGLIAPAEVISEASVGFWRRTPAQ